LKLTPPRPFRERIAERSEFSREQPKLPVEFVTILLVSEQCDLVAPSLTERLFPQSQPPSLPATRFSEIDSVRIPQE
jgi:hypothetical protein